ncbi:hypothetical protein DY000_02040023 [Brassica cretica]|uniref:RRM domain-containing protein n=1 Tax=Brassica cretica TaxID=69181 RepID=A0ABQ7B846_BRACR|nr:hypothetical protein DY000_02040023 [Brassica cretica]
MEALIDFRVENRQLGQIFGRYGNFHNIENNRLAVPGRIDRQTARQIVLQGKSPILALFFMHIP